eukprot:s1023_g12.t1
MGSPQPSGSGGHSLCSLASRALTKLQLTVGVFEIWLALTKQVEQVATDLMPPLHRLVVVQPPLSLVVVLAFWVLVGPMDRLGSEFVEEVQGESTAEL